MFYGRAAIREYLDGTPGRLMRSLKSVLGSSLMNELAAIGDRDYKYADIVTAYLRTLRERAAIAADHSLDAVVLGRPIRFVDDDAEQDRAAQETLAACARAAGFRHVEFQFEPIAAAFDYERTIANEEVGAGHRRRRRYGRLHGHSPRAWPARSRCAYRRHPRQRRHPHRRHRFRFAPQHVMGDAGARLPEHRHQGSRRAERGLLRPFDLASHQSSLRRRNSSARCASCRRSSPTRAYTADWCTSSRSGSVMSCSAGRKRRRSSSRRR